MVIICKNYAEEQVIWGCVDIIVDYIKKKCGKEYKLIIKDYKKFLEDIDLNQLTNKNFQRTKTFYTKSTIK